MINVGCDLCHAGTYGVVGHRAGQPHICRYLTLKRARIQQSTEDTNCGLLSKSLTLPDMYMKVERFVTKIILIHKFDFWENLNKIMFRVKRFFST